MNWLILFLLVSVCTGQAVNLSGNLVTTGNASFPVGSATTPFVWLSVGGHLAEPATSAAFTIYRSGDLTDPFTVSFSFSGTATISSDYTASHASAVTFLAGEFSTNVTITPVNDSAVEPPETVILSLSESNNYGFATPTSGTMYCTNDDVNTFNADILILPLNTQSGSLDATKLGAMTQNVIPGTLSMVGADLFSIVPSTYLTWPSTNRIVCNGVTNDLSGFTNCIAVSHALSTASYPYYQFTDRFTNLTVNMLINVGIGTLESDFANWDVSELDNTNGAIYGVSQFRDDPNSGGLYSYWRAHADNNGDGAQPDQPGQWRLICYRYSAGNYFTNAVFNPTNYSQIGSNSWLALGNSPAANWRIVQNWGHNNSQAGTTSYLAWAALKTNATRIDFTNPN